MQHNPYPRLLAMIGDREFLQSMVPHHAGAIQMCGKAPVRDPEILKQSIISGQQRKLIK